MVGPHPEGSCTSTLAALTAAVIAVGSRGEETPPSRAAARYGHAEVELSVGHAAGGPHPPLPCRGWEPRVAWATHMRPREVRTCPTSPLDTSRDETGSGPVDDPSLARSPARPPPRAGEAPALPTYPRGAVSPPVPDPTKRLWRLRSRIARGPPLPPRVPRVGRFPRPFPHNALCLSPSLPPARRGFSRRRVGAASDSVPSGRRQVWLVSHAPR